MSEGKKQSAIRTWFQVAWFALTNGYVRGYTNGKIFSGNTKVICFPGLNCYSCPGALAACPMGALQAVMGDATYRISLYVFGVLGLMGVVFGRLICGWMCPFGLFEDLLYKIPITKKIKNLPGHKYLRYLRFVILLVFPILLVSIVTDLTGTSAPWFCEWICPSGMLFGGIPLVAVNESLREAAGGRFIWKLAILIIITLTSIKVYRPFCKYMCPLGAIYSLFNPISSYRLVIDKEKCVSCGACQKACGMDIKTYETPNSMDCIRCGSCISACPKDAISSTWGKTVSRVKSRCFVEDFAETAAIGDVSPSVKRKATFFGILTLIHGALALYMSYLAGLANVINLRMTTDTMEGVLFTQDTFCGLFVLASSLLLITGIYIIANRAKSGALTSVKEKALLILILVIVAMVIGWGGVLIDKRTLYVVISTTIYALSLPVGTIVAVFMGSALRKMILKPEGDGSLKKLNILWVVLSVLYIGALFMEPIAIQFF